MMIGVPRETAAGVTATRVSPAAVSRGTPIIMVCSPPARESCELTRRPFPVTD
jgi:hypothetical protein